MRKGQAAMEFLMTYGWAILVVLIAIGALAYFGVLNPSRFLPNSCTLFPGMACTEFKVDATDNKVILVVRNGIGDSMEITTFDIRSSGTTSLCTGASEPVVPFTIADGAQMTMNDTACGLVATDVGSRFRAEVSLTYTLGTGGLSHTRTGQIVAQIE